MEEELLLHRKLVLARRADEKIREEYFEDEMKTPVHLGIGGEGIAVGVCHCLPEGSQSFGTYRSHALYLALTEDTDGFFAEMYGKSTGAGKGKVGSMHMSAPEQGLMATSAVVGTTIPLAVGAALANRYRGSDNLVVVFFGDGAVEEGVFWESLNFACLHRLRILFVCEDNGLAIHTPTEKRQGFRSIDEGVAGFKCHREVGDGSDVREVVATTRQILQRMADEAMPGFLHLTYVRFLEHVGPTDDFEAGYRRRMEPEELQALDPVHRLEEWMLSCGCAPSALDATKARVDEQIERSVTSAQAAPFPVAAELYTDVLA